MSLFNILVMQKSRRWNRNKRRKCDVKIISEYQSYEKQLRNLFGKVLINKEVKLVEPVR